MKLTSLITCSRVGCPAKIENDSLHFYGVSFSRNMMGGSTAGASQK